MDNTLKLNTTALRDYDSNGQEKLFPNIRRGQCPVGDICLECIKQRLEDMYLHIPGDVYVVGKL